jgi:hypothetical protein
MLHHFRVGNDAPCILKAALLEVEIDRIQQVQAFSLVQQELSVDPVSGPVNIRTAYPLK